MKNTWAVFYPEAQSEWGVWPAAAEPESWQVRMEAWRVHSGSAPQCTLPKWLRGSRMVREQFAWWQVGTWAQRIAFSIVWSHTYGARKIKLSYLQTDGGGIQLTTRCFLTQCPVETCQVIGLGFMSVSSPETPFQGYLAWLSAGEKGHPFLCLIPGLALKLLHLWVSDHTFLYWASCSILGKVSISGLCWHWYDHCRRDSLVCNMAFWPIRSSFSIYNSMKILRKFVFYFRQRTGERERWLL